MIDLEVNRRAYLARWFVEARPDGTLNQKQRHGGEEPLERQIVDP